MKILTTKSKTIMEQKELSVRMKIRKHKNDAVKLSEIIESETSTELEKKVASEYLAKLQEVEQPEEEVVAPQAPEEPTLFPETEEEKPSPKKEEPISSELTPEEVERLDAAEKKFDERQASRKTPSKGDKNMREERKKKRSTTNLHEGKRENLEESTEVPGLKIGSTVKVGVEEGSVIRVYRSTDGKEKCMVKIGGGKPVKKRVTSVELVK
mgnify:CR=1 FL=1